MRYLALLCLSASPVSAWEFSPTPICTLSHVEGGADVTVTYDAVSAFYAITVERPGGWPDAPVFSIRFSGAPTISTQRHQLKGNALSVTDTGFGNVLGGLAGGGVATAFTDVAEVSFSLAGAAGPVDAFRACTSAPTA